MAGTPTAFRPSALLLLAAGTAGQEVSPVARVAGRCLIDAATKPAAAAPRVTLFRLDHRLETAEVVRETRAAADGRFAFDAVPWVRGHDWGFGAFLVVARQGSRVGLRMLRGDECRPEQADVELAEARTVRGTVVDERNAPIAGARVHARFFHLPQGLVFLTSPLPQWTALTDARGVFELAGLPAAKLTLFASHPVHAQDRIDVEVSETGEAEIVLRPGSTIVGRVRFPDGSPAAGVAVQAQGTRASAWAQAWTGQDGRYRLESLPEEPFNVWAVVPEWTCAAHDSFAVTPGKEITAKDIVLVRGGIVTGRVIDDATGKPVQPGERSDVGLYGPSRPRTGAAIEYATIGTDGGFSIRAAPGSNYIYLRSQGWSGGSHDVVVREGEKVEVEFRVRREKQAKE